MRPIDADALIRSLEVDPVECPGCPEPEYLGEIIEMLREAPTIDISPDARVKELLELVEEICKDVRETHGGDDVCGLCEYDGPAWMECPGFDKDDCFVLRQSVKERYIGREEK